MFTPLNNYKSDPTIKSADSFRVFLARQYTPLAVSDVPICNKHHKHGQYNTWHYIRVWVINLSCQESALPSSPMSSNPSTAPRLDCNLQQQNHTASWHFWDNLYHLVMQGWSLFQCSLCIEQDWDQEELRTCKFRVSVVRLKWQVWPSCDSKGME